MPGVVACAFVMVMAAAQVIQSAVNELLGAPRLLEVGLQPHAASLHTPCSQPAHTLQPACTHPAASLPPECTKVGLLNICIMASTTVVKLGLWAWYRRTVNAASAALEPKGGCGALGRALGAAPPQGRWAAARTAALAARVQSGVQRRGCGAPVVHAEESPMPRPLRASRCKEVFRKTHNVTVEAVAQDNLNDVLTNAVALASALAAASVAPLWVVDPIGAILLSLFIIGSWVRAADREHRACPRGRVCVSCVRGACVVRAWCVRGACVVRARASMAPLWCCRRAPAVPA